ncbi:hypothetical protein [Pedobacter nototheniae]|uniref:hypothetical protein n=1 Tax=Pedobacter nototheniae TaxID=2488994 RepID=UPI0029314C07|nr:hypothetical protein [Pedobacter nototheniae]
MIRQEVKIIGAYLISGLFVLVPSLLLFDLTYGFSISEKNIKKQAERQSSVAFDQEGIIYKMPLFDTTLLIYWDSIKTVIFRNYNSDENAQFIFYLTKLPLQTLSENPWWLNRIFPNAIKNKNVIVIKDDCKGFREIPKMIETYLGKVKAFDPSEDHRKGTLLSSKTTIKQNAVQTEEHWKPINNYEPEKVIFDQFDRNIDEINRQNLS